jgi:hypothetical protein
VLIDAPSPLAGEGITGLDNKLAWVRGCIHKHCTLGTDTPHPALRATFSLKGRREENYTGVKNGSGAPSVGLNTTFTFWPIFNLSMSQSTMLVCKLGPSFSVT